MREGVNAVHLIAEFLSCDFRDTLGRVVNAANGVDDPHFVARSNPAVLTLLAHERGHSQRFEVLGRRRSVLVLDAAREPSGKVVRVNPASCRDVLRRATDWKS